MARVYGSMQMVVSGTTRHQMAVQLGHLNCLRSQKRDAAVQTQAVFGYKGFASGRHFLWEQRYPAFWKISLRPWESPGSRPTDDVR
ncbi:hypothetical protein BBF93_06610 [Hyphomonas sp. CACIAM 19H1]|nr:hypothetical protein BBF93_06610 [Hyphomonas sp. CACIAM 19H1]